MTQPDVKRQRKIIHIDMDAFFASVEQRDNPDLIGKPVVVGGQPDSRGVVAACSYEARAFGVHSAMPCAQAYRLCPDVIFVKPRFDAYRAASKKLHEVFREYTDVIEPLSLDEAFLDVTHCGQLQGSATLIATEIKQKVRERLNLVVSAGVSFNKFLAKIASDMDKPDGLFVIRPEQADDFIAGLPIRKFFGVGKVTEQKMQSLGINTGADLREWSEADLKQKFGKQGGYYFRIARGIDDRPVRVNRERKSIGKETTFANDLNNLDKIKEVLEKIAAQIVELIANKNLVARTLSLKVKYHDFTLITRSLSKETLFVSKEDVLAEISGLIDRTELGSRPCRLLGLTLSNFQGQDNKSNAATENQTLDLWK